MADSKPNILFIILSVIIPLAGIVLYFVKKESEPENAKIYLYVAVVMIILGFLGLVI